MYFSWLWYRGSIWISLRDPETRTIVRSSDVVFNEKIMHKQSIKSDSAEVRKVMFQDVTPSISVQKNNSTPMPNSPTNVHPYEDACVQPENSPTLVQ